MKKICKNDEVVVLVGKDRNRRGIVSRCIDSDYVLVEGVNRVKKAVKPNPKTGESGGLIDKLMPIHISNIALWNATAGKADRVGFKVIDGKKVRIYKSNGEVVKEVNRS